MKKIFSFIVLLLFVFNLHAARVDTVSIYSKSMQKNFNCVVIQPDPKTISSRWPVVYLLHGYSGNHSDWIKKVPLLKQYVDEFKIMIVCPDGGYSSWYLDSPVDETMRYETYIAEEVPVFIDARFPT